MKCRNFKDKVQSLRIVENHSYNWNISELLIHPLLSLSTDFCRAEEAPSTWYGINGTQGTPLQRKGFLG